ncbi:MAG TPA: hypothetical protein VL326_22530 [Kofleriaceae bacterium]|nr:hypothetical protein [Kofleriaceae bacterium]
MKLALAVIVLLVACADHKQRKIEEPTGGSGSQGSAMQKGSGNVGNASVTVTVVGTKPGRPPVDRLLVDVQLKNDDPAPRWVLIPSKLPPENGGGVDKLEQLTVPAGTTTIAVGRFLGRAGTYAVKLAPGARLTMHKLELSWWRENNEKEAAFDVQLANEVKLGDASMTTWFDKDPAISGAADVDMDAAKHTRSQKSPTGDEVPLVAEQATSAPIHLAAP